MILSEEQKQAITNEYNQFVEVQYAGKTKKERQELGAFFTPPQLTIRMIEKFTNLEGTILDPTCGAGGLLAAVILAEADPTKCYGIELDPAIANVAKERLGKLGVPSSNIKVGDALLEGIQTSMN
jgi:type I restriction-modification system DNA methylase subunit